MLFSEDFIVAAYIIIFGLATALLEFQIPPWVSRFASFYFSFLGRGVFYLFIGSITLDSWWPGYVTGALVMFVGVAYIILEFLPQIEAPANMQSPDAGVSTASSIGIGSVSNVSQWGGEQV